MGQGPRPSNNRILSTPNIFFKWPQPFSGNTKPKETQLRAYDGVGGTHALRHARGLSKERTDYSILVRRLAV